MFANGNPRTYAKDGDTATDAFNEKTNGVAKSNNEKMPKTGDESKAAEAVALLLISGAALVATKRFNAVD
jgi:LPXTG-motif cell wall-anchored protein